MTKDEREVTKQPRNPDPTKHSLTPDESKQDDYLWHYFRSLSNRFPSTSVKFHISKLADISFVELRSITEYLTLHAATDLLFKKFIQSADLNKDNEIDFAEFLKYVCEHQKKLRLVFQHLDSNQDGRININEIRNGLADLGIDISQSEAENLLDKIHRQQTTSNSLSKNESKSENEDGGRGGGSELASIEWEQWRDYHLLHPTDNVEDIISYWRHGSNLDVGDDLRVPDELPEQEKAGLRLVNTLISGGAAGAVSRTCTAPIDRLKVLLQVHSSSKNPLGVFSGLRQLLSEGGLSGLWRGNGLNVLKIAPESAIKFLTYEKMKHLIKGDKSDITAQQRFVAGSIAGLSAQTTIYPLEVLKTKMVLRKTGEYSSIVDCASKVYREGGLRVFYRGYIPNALGIIPYAGIDLMVYETLKYRYLSHNASATKPEQESSSNNSNTNPGVCVLLFCGAVSSSCGQLASYPFALLRTKMQDQTASQKRQPSMRQLAMHIVKTEGLQGLYRGIIPNFIKVIPAVSISYVVYEHTKRALNL
ncbi:mitochondrial adenyl nucleotide antiporter SLC25A25-like isoform X2 [Convolutriloba macropyga]|uniref:mitochondrial adenyl nucleotide antiporter SLC25A25-like isoform X2 n=1 Tax=Convolutriloba macropyga TaxID=536237 RepID=UPI003F528D47